MTDKILVFGHKSPDTDSICSAIAYAHISRTAGWGDAEPVALGTPNNETRYVLDRFGVREPKIIESVEGEKVVLVDHNAPEQSAPGLEKAEIVAVIDHHKLGGLKTPSPIWMTVRPWGSTATILYDLAEAHGIALPKEIKALLLAAIISDTLLFNSPTTTPVDKNTALALARDLEIDTRELGMEMFRAKSQLDDKTDRDLLYVDSKEFDYPNAKILVAQIETVEPEKILSRPGLYQALEQEAKEKGYHTVLLVVTNILENDSTALVYSQEPERIERAFGAKIEDNKMHLPGVVSRKKQIVPPLEKEFANG